MQRLAQTRAVTTEFYPKIHAKNDGSFELISSGTVEVEKFLLEPLKEVPENTEYMYSSGSFGGFFVKLPVGGSPVGDNSFYVTTFGSNYDGSMWINSPIPEPENIAWEESGLIVWAYDSGSHEYIYVLPQVAGFGGIPFEYQGKYLASIESGILLDLEDYDDINPQVWVQPEIPSSVMHSGTYPGEGIYAYSLHIPYDDGGPSAS